jgi:hypothetical protein
VGKSTILGVLAGWLEQHGVPWRGFDLDPDHRSFSRLFPEKVALTPLGDEPEGDVIKLLRTCVGSPVTVLDPRAHLSDVLIRAFELIRFPEGFAESGGRITVLLFPADDLEVMTDLDRTVSQLGGAVDYIVVKNRARAPRTRMFDGSELEADLGSLGAEVLEIPALLSMARNHLAALEADLGRGVPHVEAVMNRELRVDPMVRMVIEDWTKGNFRSLDRLAHKLLPTDLIVARSGRSGNPAGEAGADPVAVATTPPVRRGAKINRENL